MRLTKINQFIKTETKGSILLFTASLLALILANSPWTQIYNAIQDTPLVIFAYQHTIKFSLADFINNGLMVIFFFTISLEIKRELMEGELSTRAKATLPVIAAVGGIIFPAIIYLMINFNQPHLLQGWAIPTATDITFSLGVLALLKTKIPNAIKVLLTAFAIVDDLGAILIITFFYSHHLELLFLALAILCILVLALFNYLKIELFWPYALVGLLLWFFILQSGVHTTIAGVILGCFIPLTSKHPQQKSLLHHLEKQLQPWVTFVILPLFALVNMDVPFSDFKPAEIFTSLPLGIIFGLLLGKQLGIFSACWLAIKSGLAELPTQVHWKHLYGMAIIGGIGFTMSLYIATMAFPPDNLHHLPLARVGILIGSVLSGILGYFVLCCINPSAPSRKTAHSKEKAILK